MAYLRDKYNIVLVGLVGIEGKTMISPPTIWHDNGSIFVGEPFVPNILALIAAHDLAHRDETTGVAGASDTGAYL